MHEARLNGRGLSEVREVLGLHALLQVHHRGGDSIRVSGEGVCGEAGYRSRGCTGPGGRCSPPPNPTPLQGPSSVSGHPRRPCTWPLGPTLDEVLVEPRQARPVPTSGCEEPSSRRHPAVAPKVDPSRDLESRTGDSFSDRPPGSRA